jgi:hypothetical protein
MEEPSFESQVLTKGGTLGQDLPILDSPAGSHTTLVIAIRDMDLVHSYHFLVPLQLLLELVAPA